MGTTQIVFGVGYTTLKRIRRWREREKVPDSVTDDRFIRGKVMEMLDAVVPHVETDENTEGDDE